MNNTPPHIKLEKQRIDAFLEITRIQTPMVQDVLTSTNATLQDVLKHTKDVLKHTNATGKEIAAGQRHDLMVAMGLRPPTPNSNQQAVQLARPGNPFMNPSQEAAAAAPHSAGQFQDFATAAAAAATTTTTNTTANPTNAYTTPSQEPAAAAAPSSGGWHYGPASNGQQAAGSGGQSATPHAQAPPVVSIPPPPPPQLDGQVPHFAATATMTANPGNQFATPSRESSAVASSTGGFHFTPGSNGQQQLATTMTAAAAGSGGGFRFNAASNSQQPFTMTAAAAGSGGQVNSSRQQQATMQPSDQNLHLQTHVSTSTQMECVCAIIEIARIQTPMMENVLQQTLAAALDFASEQRNSLLAAMGLVPPPPTNTRTKQSIGTASRSGQVHPFVTTSHQLRASSYPFQRPLNTATAPQQQQHTTTTSGKRRRTTVSTPIATVNDSNAMEIDN